MATPDCRSARVFGLVYEALSDMMGSAATATLMRRAIKRATMRAPELSGLEIQRERFEYRYAVPAPRDTDERVVDDDLDS